MTARTTLHELGSLGQAVWLDSISREWLESGELARMRDELGIVGVTSNPTIFAQALKSDAYDTELRELAAAGLDDREIFERLAVDDIRAACDVMMRVYEESNGLDGMVSIELEPDLADDTAASSTRGRELWHAVDRPNLMIKVPATDAGLPVIEELLEDGINVNVTLLFDVSVYREVMERHIRALEARSANGLDVDVASVASFFVSRVDTKVDAALETSEAAPQLRGRIAVANAVAAWEAHRSVYAGERWNALQARGARPQRPLWASTGTKNPDYSDILYVQDLVVGGTVNTMPLATIHAFADHGEAKVTIDDAAIERARGELDELAAAGVDLGQVTDELRTEGVASFQASFEELLAGIADKRAAVTT